MRLIDADALQKEFEELASNQWNQETGTSWANGFAEAAERVADAPTVDAVERKRGEWIKQMDEQAWWYECSVFGDYPLKNAFGHESLSRFCPWCGAEMRGEANDTRRSKIYS